MDAHDIFRKLSFGAKFDFKRFREDAERFKLVKKKEATEDDAKQKSKQAFINGNIQADENGVEDLTKDVTDQESDETDDEGEVTVLKHLKKASPKKKQKTKVLTKEKLAEMKKEQVNHFRKQHKIFVWGSDIPEPCATFDQLANEYSLHPSIVKNVEQMGYTEPTPIQMQAIPLMMHRRELLACAPTGSGKTAAFLIPVINYLKHPKKDGFRALILAPTRELAQQIFRDCLKLADTIGLRIHIIKKAGIAAKKFAPGSSNKFDILISTPNRLIYLLKQEPPAICLKNVEWLVIDEADKLFEAGKQGFRDQLAVIYKACDSANVRRAMFSATFAPEVEEWCKLNLDNVVTVSVGIRNSAVELIKQELLFVGNESGKLLAFRDIVKKGLNPPVLVFVQTKERARELFNELIYDGINVDVIHAERTQQQRDNVIKSFRSGKIWVLICTELMGRGIDFKGVNLVVNYDFPPSAISYIHRIGRTGRAGRPGHAITFFTEEDAVNLRSIAQVMHDSGCKVPEYMLKMKKPTKQEKRELARKAPKRERISTIPEYDLEREAKIRKKIEKTKKKKKMLEQKADSNSKSDEGN